MAVGGIAGLLEELSRALAERDGAARRLAALDDRIRDLSARLLGRETPMPLPPPLSGLPAPGARPLSAGEESADGARIQPSGPAETVRDPEVREIEERNEELSQSLGRALVTLAQAEDNVGRLFQRIDRLERNEAEASRRLAEAEAGVENRDRQIARLVLDALARGLILRPEGFDEEAYLAHNPDVRTVLQSAPAAGGALEHWVRWGVREGRRTHFRRIDPGSP